MAQHTNITHPESIPELPHGVVNCMVYGPGGRKRHIGLESIHDVLAVDDGSFIWIGLYEPENAVLEVLQEAFDLHDLAIEDAATAHQRPKMELYDQSMFIVASTAQVVEERIALGETHIFVGPRHLITVRHGASLSYASACARVEREPELLALGPSYALYAVLDAIIDNYLPIVDTFKQTLSALERQVTSDAFDRSTLIRLYDLKRELTYLRVAAIPMQTVLSQLVRSPSRLIAPEARFYFRDVLDHSSRINESVDAMRDMLTTALSVNQSLVNLAQGEVVKRLAGWAALLALPTLITSWYGMNFDAMPELHGRYSYLILTGCVAALVGGLYAWLKRIGWL